MPTFDLEARPEIVPQARARVRGVLGDWGASDVQDDVDLVLTELLGNVVLHAPGPARVVVERVHLGVRLEVRDESVTRPVRRLAGTAATTGRGLNLVAAICSDWGVRSREDDRPGKTVWCLVPHLPQAEVVPDVDVEALLAAFDRDDALDDAEVQVGEAPVALLVAAKDHLDSVLRELTLAEGGSSLPVEVVEPMVRAVRRFGPARAQLRAQLAAATARGDSRVQLTFRLPVEQAAFGEQYLRVLARADAFARDRRLLSLESSVEHRVLREWYVHGLVRGLRQVAAGQPQEPGGTFEDRLLEELHVLERSRRATEMGALLQQVTARLAEAETVTEIARIAVAEGVAALAAAGGSLTRRDAGATVASAEVGDDLSLAARYAATPLRLRPAGPSTEVLRTGKAVWVQGREDRDARFPHLAQMQPRAVAIAVVPLFAGKDLVGALRLSWPEPRVFSEPERAFLDGLAVQAGQALARADALAESDALRNELDLHLTARGSISSTDLAVLRTLYEDPPLGIAVIGTDRRYRRINTFLARVNGRAPEAHVGRLVGEVVAEQLSADQLSGLEDLLDQVLLQGRTIRQVVHDNARPVRRWWRTSWLPVRDTRGRIEALVLLVGDITPERQTEEHTRVLAAFSRRLAACSSPGAVADALVGTIVPDLADRSAVQLVATDHRVSLVRAPDGAAPWASPSPEDTGHAEGITTVLTTGRSLRLREARSAGDPPPPGPEEPDGLDVVIVPIEAAGTTFGTISVARVGGLTLSDEELSVVESLGLRAGSALEALRAAAASLRLELALEMGEVGSFEWHVPTGQLAADDRLLELIGVDPGTAAPTIETILDAAHPDDAAELRHRLQRAAQSGGSGGVHRVRRADGSVAWLQTSLRALPHPGGSVARVIGTARLVARP
ncbi:MAG: hypothetical protein JWL64_2453 [Frankiales bacterium]|nr:hypothetical protein [Frankiales bacterium]